MHTFVEPHPEILYFDRYLTFLMQAIDHHLPVDIAVGEHLRLVSTKTVRDKIWFTSQSPGDLPWLWSDE